MKLPVRDIHNHLLPGVDDGFRHTDSTLHALHAMAEAGCKELVFTPHMNPDVYPDMKEADFRKVYAELVPQIPTEWGVKTSLAAEYMVVKDFENRASDPSQLLTFEDGSILIEMSYYFRSSNLEDTLFNLKLSGLKPILAHPERYLYMIENLKDYDNWHEMGCRFQLNLMSLTGAYGPASLKILKYLLDKGWYDFVATDLHSTQQLDRIFQSKPKGFRLRRAARKSLGV